MLSKGFLKNTKESHKEGKRHLGEICQNHEGRTQEVRFGNHKKCRMVEHRTISWVSQKNPWGYQGANPQNARPGSEIWDPDFYSIGKKWPPVKPHTLLSTREQTTKREGKTKLELG